MTVLLMASAKVFLNTPLSEWQDIISQETVLITEKNVDLIHSLNNMRTLFKDVLILDDYYEDSHVTRYVLNKNIEFNFSKIIALSEGDLLRAAYLRDVLKIPGETEADLIYFRDKDKMKNLASSYGVRVARHAVIMNAESAFSFSKKYAFPLILKPIDGRGSASTFKVTSLEELTLILRKTDVYPVLIEEYIEGDMYHIDGIVIDGLVKICSPAKYVNNCLSFVSGENLGSYILMTSNPLREKLIQLSTYLLEKVFPTPKLSLFHIEVFVDAQQNVTLCEIAARMGGNSINKEILLAYGVDIKRCYLDYCYGKKVEISDNITPYRCAGRYLIPPQNGSLIKLPNQLHADFIVEQFLNIKESNVYQKMQMSNNELISFLLIADNEKNMLENFEKILFWKKNELLWDLKE